MRSFILRLIAFLLALTMLAGGVSAQSRKKKRAKQSKATASKPETVKPAEPAQTSTGAPTFSPQPVRPDDGVRRITPVEAHEALAKGTAIIVDVRNDGAYKSGHIKGAVSIPSNEVKARIDKLPRNKLIITYCS
jgi:3-mercaptopyruvate sulfurtransferase SseA